MIENKLHVKQVNWNNEKLEFIKQTTIENNIIISISMFLRIGDFINIVDPLELPHELNDILLNPEGFKVIENYEFLDYMKNLRDKIVTYNILESGIEICNFYNILYMLMSHKELPYISLSKIKANYFGIILSNLTLSFTEIAYISKDLIRKNINNAEKIFLLDENIFLFFIKKKNKILSLIVKLNIVEGSFKLLNSYTIFINKTINEIIFDETNNKFLILEDNFIKKELIKLTRKLKIGELM